MTQLNNLTPDEFKIGNIQVNFGDNCFVIRCDGPAGLLQRSDVPELVSYLTMRVKAEEEYENWKSRNR